MVITLLKCRPYLPMTNVMGGLYSSSVGLMWFRETQNMQNWIERREVCLGMESSRLM